MSRHSFLTCWSDLSKEQTLRKAFDYFGLEINIIPGLEQYLYAGNFFYFIKY